MTAPSTRPAEPSPTRPPDVDTGFWLWVAALPLLATAYLLDNFTSPVGGSSLFLRGMSVLVLVVVSALVVTFLLLMRQGYRWSRTVLSAGGFGSIVYTVTNLFTVQRESAVTAVGYAGAAIVGSVLVAGGLFLLHRKDADAFFTR
ncbi:MULTISPECIES: hypothetical protein [Mycobacteriaceae]|uniref:hypothetical protein n=1 Tax=Mycobacteriaceae TaxID=1762 RepID=UPI00080136D4|nr:MULTISPECIES: hypothetical protein [Mycobacteriaceae]MCK0175752.1 hypothetical protein [Mycolicibacterium sp. F2034L]OBB60163.1 hypothetical protein A5757_10875 [Mycobacterium sp. 852013-51886_SCH5428379]